MGPRLRSRESSVVRVLSPIEVETGSKEDLATQFTEGWILGASPRPIGFFRRLVDRCCVSATVSKRNGMDRNAHFVLHDQCRIRRMIARRRAWPGLFHRDPKRIVGVLRVTLLNRLNSSREWEELPLGRQTLHHDRPSGCRGL